MKYSNKWIKNPRLVRVTVFIFILCIIIISFLIVRHNLLNPKDYEKVKMAAEGEINSADSEEVIELFPVNNREKISDRLTGKIEFKGIISVSDGTKAALIETNYGSITMQEGETIGGLTLIAINDRGVLLNNAGNVIELTYDSSSYTILE